MIEVAAAGVSLMPVARGFRARVEREIGGQAVADEGAHLVAEGALGRAEVQVHRQVGGRRGAAV